MDVLSEVLRTVRLQSALFFPAEFSAPWCVRTMESAQAASFLPAQPGHLIPYHLLLEGAAYAQLEAGGPRERLAAGDLVVFPGGDAHRLGQGAGARPMDGLRLLADRLGSNRPSVRHGGGGAVARFICGFLSCEPRLSRQLFGGLPPMIRVPVLQGPSGPWIENCIQSTISQGIDAGPGGSLVLAKLSELLLVETLRVYMSALPAEQTGWLAAARDSVIGRALALMHQQPEHPWTVAQLALRSGYSRTRFAERFHTLLGQPPMMYLAGWRLTLAADRLRDGSDSIAEIASEVGYSSEAAFIRAFKRAYQCPPARFRRQQQVVKHPPQPAGDYLTART